MRTTLNIPDELINEAMKVSKCKTKTELIKTALENLITKEKIKDLTKYYGRLTLDIDLEEMRNR